MTANLDKPAKYTSLDDMCDRLTKRELFAAMAMQGMLSNPDPSVMSASAGTHALWAVAAADALLFALEAPGGAG